MRMKIKRRLSRSITAILTASVVYVALPFQAITPNIHAADTENVGGADADASSMEMNDDIWFDTANGLVYLPATDAGELGGYDVVLALSSNGEPLSFVLQDAMPTQTTTYNATYDAMTQVLSIPSIRVGLEYYAVELKGILSNSGLRFDILSTALAPTDTNNNTLPETTCTQDRDIDTLVCAVEHFFSTLNEDELATAKLDWSESVQKTVWSNLPGVNRNGLRIGDMDDDTLEAMLAVAKAALSEKGYDDFIGITLADDYLGTLSGSGMGGPGGDMGEPPTDMGDMPTDMGEPPADMGEPPTGGMQGGGLTYSAENYYIAVFGEPSAEGDWMLQIGGHHLAYNITYLGGRGYPVPHHAGVEPKSSFEIYSATYAPLAEEGDAMVAMFDALSAEELATAFLADEVYSDVLMGPDNGSGALPTTYPDSTGVLVADLSSEQQAVVKAAIGQWVEDYASDVATALMAEYTSEEAFSQTYIAWAGTESAGVDVDVANTYMRIDGPRLWIEVACQNGVVVSGKTHYHTMFRDKVMDYGNSL